ncbi:MAG: DUF4340 domain-containing protein [Ruminococcaceae bacterium]|nr:DUF4340 domain-containing protein [Oscillospiraceae bacterium]
MTKNNKIIIISGVLLIILLAAVYGIMSIAGKSSETDDKGETNITETVVEKVFSQNTPDKLNSILLSKDGKNEYFIRRDETIGNFLIDGLEKQSYSDSFDYLISSVMGLSVIEKIDDPLADSEYGLSFDSSPYILTVTFTDGKSETVYIGSQLLTGNGYYCKKESETSVFVIGNAANSFLKDKYSLVSPLLEKELDRSKYHYTENLEVYKNNEKLVHIALVPENLQDKTDAYGYYTMLYPSNEYSVSDVSYDNMLKMLISPQVNTVITTDLSDENLIKYGFMAEDGSFMPSCEINYTLDGEKRILYFGKRTEDGLVYIMSPRTSFIGIAGVESHFPFIDWELIDYVNPALFGMNINHLSKLTVQGYGITDTYTTEGEGKELVVKNHLGAVINTQNFRNFYRVLLMTNMEGYAESKNTDDWMLSFRIEKRDGRVTEYKFYRISNLKCFYTVNGKGEFYVSLDDVEKILSDAKKLAAGEEIDPDARV